MKQQWKILLLVLLALPIKMIWEGAIRREAKESQLFSADFNAGMRDKISQGAAIAVLSGFRGMVADFTWLAAHNNWEKREWFRMKPKLETVVQLQPHFLDYWDIGAWHMAWNISYDVSVDTAEPRPLFRLKQQQYWIDEGEKFLREGIRNNPDSYLLIFKLGWLLDQKQKRYAEAADYFKKASEMPGAPLYVRRQVGHALAKAGKKREALEWWRKLWAMPHNAPESAGELWDRIEIWIRDLEIELKVPMNERTFPAESYKNYKPTPVYVPPARLPKPPPNPNHPPPPGPARGPSTPPPGGAPPPPR